ncbi:MAG: NAD(P)-dependent oxidoreductase [Bacteroidota bacterium]
MKTILLTGGNGFIGRNIQESFLAEKYNIIAPSSKELNIADCEAIDDFFQNNSIDVIIHSACKPGHRNAKDPTELFKTNTQMFFNLERHASNYEKMLVIGSGAIYDMRNYKPKMKEEYFGTHIPVDDHGLTKYTCEKVIEKSNNIIDLRVFGIFGKYEDYSIRFISNLICKAIFDLPLTVNQNRKFDYLCINDLMPVLDYFITHTSKYSCYNVTPDYSIELISIAEIIKTISGKNLPIITSKEGLGLEYSGDNTRLKNEIINFRFTSIEAAIEKLYVWYNDNKDLINKEAIIKEKF